MSYSYTDYLEAIKKPFHKIAKLDFLQPDNSIAFSLDNNHSRGYMTKYDSRAFIQSGSLSVSLNNGQRRKATITLANRDNAFDYAVNNIWFGQRVRLSIGIRFPDGEDFYLPQMVGYINIPSLQNAPEQRTITFPLVDKWAALDGTVSGTLPNSHKIDVDSDIRKAMQSILQLSKYTLESGTDSLDWLDNVLPIFTNYYDGKTYTANASDGTIKTDIAVWNTPYTVTEKMGSTTAKLLLELNDMVAGIIGYNATGNLTLEPSQDDLTDASKPVLWTFKPTEKQFLKLTENVKTSDVYNDVIVVGTGLSGAEVWGRAQNFDPKSETNINLIGLKTLVETGANYWNASQCQALAEWKLKRKTILQKSITISSSQMFHLAENSLVRVQRSDKSGSPIEAHLINSFTLPIAEMGEMTINCTSVNDIDTITTSTSGEDSASA